MTTQTQHERAICRFIKRPPTALYDLGVGPKSEWRTLGRQYPAMRLCGCEPNPKMHADLLAAGFPGPLPQVAIGETNGAAILHVPPGNLKCCSLLPVRYAKASAAISVAVWTLDFFDTMMGQQERILLWMDIEGAELAALRSGPKLLASGRVKWINLEERRDGHLPAEGWADPKKVDRLLKDAGYLRKAAYNKHRTHQDAIYVHQGEA